VLPVGPLDAPNRLAPSVLPVCRVYTTTETSVTGRRFWDKYRCVPKVGDTSSDPVSCIASRPTPGGWNSCCSRSYYAGWSRQDGNDTQSSSKSACFPNSLAREAVVTGCSLRLQDRQRTYWDEYSGVPILSLVQQATRQSDRSRPLDSQIRSTKTELVEGLALESTNTGCGHLGAVSRFYSQNTTQIGQP